MKLEMEFRFLCENIMHPRNTIYFFPDTYCFSVTFSVFSSSLTTTDFVGLSSFCSTLCSVVTSEIVSLIFILLAKMDYNNLITAFFLKLQSIAFINITRKKSVAFRNSTFLFKIRKCLLANFSCFISQNGIYEISWETGAVLTEDLNAKAIVNDHSVCDSYAFYGSTRQCKARITYKLSIPCNVPRQVDISGNVENRCCIFPWWTTTSEIKRPLPTPNIHAEKYTRNEFLKVCGM